MERRIVVLGAPTSLGIRPYDDSGAVRQLDRAPAVLRECDVIERLGAEDAGDVVSPEYVDLTRVGVRPRNENGLAQYSLALADRVAEIAATGSFVVVLGGDCSIVLGCLLGARRVGGDRMGLVYIDGHSDFATPEESQTGSISAMCAAFAVGRGDSPLARLAGSDPLVREIDTAIVGRRDEDEVDESWARALRSSDILDLPHSTVREHCPAATANTLLRHFEQAGTSGYWVHLDVDVLDPSIMPAVDSPEPNGLSVDEVVELVAPLAATPGAIGMQLTIYDPYLDPERGCATVLVSMLERVLSKTRSTSSMPV